MSPNQGVTFGAAAGLRGVTTDPRDMGYPQVSFADQFSTIGDPASFISREDRSYELYDNVLVDRGSHRFKAGGYLFRFEFNPVNPNAARGAFTFNGQWTGNAFADFLLGYPSSAQVGIGRADEHGRSTWFHVYAQDDWKARSNLTINYGLRYEINGQMHDVDNRLSAIDLTVPGGRFVVASDDAGTISSAATPLLSQIPIAYVTSRDAGWTNGLLRPSYRRFAPRLGIVRTVGDDGHTVVNAGFATVVSDGVTSDASSMSSNPTTARSSGTASPIATAASRTPIAMRSFEQNTAVRKEQDPIADGFHFVHVVRRPQHAHLLVGRDAPHLRADIPRRSPLVTCLRSRLAV